MENAYFWVILGLYAAQETEQTQILHSRTKVQNLLLEKKQNVQFPVHEQIICFTRNLTNENKKSKSGFDLV